MRPDGKIQYADYLTVLNGVAGFLAITYIIDGKFLETSLLILAALCLDGLDGYVARRFGGGGDGRGHYLDSFADTISFCIAPALMLYRRYYDISRGTAWVAPENALAVGAATLVAAFGILRLARFVGTDHTKGHFKGLPTPANAVLLTSAAFLFGTEYGVPVLLFSILTSFFMISSIPYPKIEDTVRSALGLVIVIVGGVALVYLKVVANIAATLDLIFYFALIATVGYLIGGPVYASRPRSREKVLRVQRE